MKYFSALTALLLISSLATAATNKLPVIDAYVTVLDAQHLRSLRVNVEKSSDPDGRISKTEISFGDGFVSASPDVIHAYAADGTYNLRLRVWDNKNAMTESNQSVVIASNLVMNAANDVSVYGPQVIKDNRSYSFNMSSLPAGSLYKLVLTKKPPQGLFAVILDAFNHLTYVLFGFNIFDLAPLNLNIAMNGIDVFQDGEITKNTLQAEKFVGLKAANVLAVNIDNDHINQYSVEIKKVGFVKDTQPPVVAVAGVTTNGLLTNNNQLQVSVSDISGGTTTYVWKTQLQADNNPVPLNAGDVNTLIITSTAANFSIPLTEGVNYFIIQTVDKFNNKSDFIYLNNIVLDTTLPLLSSVSPALGENKYTYTLPYDETITLHFSENVQSVKINGKPATINGKDATGTYRASQKGQNDLAITATDMAGNSTSFNHSYNVVLVNGTISLSFTVPRFGRTNSASFVSSYSFVTNFLGDSNPNPSVPARLKFWVNDVEALSTTNTSGNVTFNLPLEGVNHLHYSINYEVPGFDSSPKYIGDYEIIRDTAPPVITAFTPSSSAPTYTNHLPITVSIGATFDGPVDHISINDGFDIPLLGGTTFTGQIPISGGGHVPIKISVTDLAGNITTLIKYIDVIFDNTPPVIAFGAAAGLAVNIADFHLPVSITSDTPVTTRIKLNGVDVGTFYDFSFDALIHLLQEGLNTISLTVTDAAGNVATKDFTVNLDTHIPQLTSLDLNGGQPIFTNHLPITLDLNAIFDELVQSIQINDGLIQSVISTSFSGHIEINNHGLVPIKLRVTDMAGNVTDIVRNVQINFSDVAPTLTFATPILGLLTNNPSINFDGISSELLKEIKLNGLPLPVGPDGKSFSGVFNAPADGVFDLIFDFIDKYGNIGTLKTRVRVLERLTPDILNYPGPTLTFNKPFYEVDPGGLFSGGPTGDVCQTLTQIFGDPGIEEIDPTPYLADFAHGEIPKIPRQDQLMSFLNDNDDPIHKLKAGFLLVCKGFTIKPIGGDCQENRKLIKAIMGQYPEPLIVKAIPGLLPSVQDFIIKRYNICTGFDMSDLSCKDAVEILPLIADLVIPGTGQALSSPVGQFVMEAVLCKELCDNPVLKTTPVCLQPPLPKMPDFPFPKGPPMRFGPPGVSGPGWDWGGGGGGGGFELCSSGGGWFDSILPGCDDGGGGGGGGGGSGGTIRIDITDIGGVSIPCANLPFVFSCSADLPIPQPTITIDPRVTCDPATWRFSDIFLAATNLNISPTVAFISTIANCIDLPVPGAPSRIAPLLTVTEPTANQLVTGSTVRVKGYVNKTNAHVAVEGAAAATVLGVGGLYFDVTIPVPADGKVNVQAIDDWGNEAAPVEIQLSTAEPSDNVSQMSVGSASTCAIQNGVLKCWGPNTYGAVGDGTTTPRSNPTAVVGLPAGNIQQIVTGAYNSCALVDGAVYCWGFMRILGTNISNLLNSSVPILVAGLESNVRFIAVGTTTACAIKTDDSLYCWGNNPDAANVGLGIPVGRAPQLAATGIKTVSIGSTAVVVIKNDGTVAWFGRLGSQHAPNLIAVDGLSGGITSIMVALSTACAAGPNDIKCWGIMPDGSTFNMSAFSIAPISSPVTLMSASSMYRTLCYVESGALKCWGDTSYGITGVYPDYEGNTLATVSDMSSGVTALSVFDASVCTLRNGNMYCWGGVIENYVGPVKINF